MGPYELHVNTCEQQTIGSTQCQGKSLYKVLRRQVPRARTQSKALFQSCKFIGVRMPIVITMIPECKPVDSGHHDSGPNQGTIQWGPIKGVCAQPALSAVHGLKIYESLSSSSMALEQLLYSLACRSLNMGPPWYQAAVPTIEQ